MFQDFRNHIKKGGWHTLIATASIWVVWFTGKWCLAWLASESLTSTIFTIWLPVGVTFYGVISDREGEGDALKAFWKGWRDMGIKAHLLIIGGCVIFMNLTTLVVFFVKKIIFHKPSNHEQNINFIADGKF